MQRQTACQTVPDRLAITSARVFCRTTAEKPPVSDRGNPAVVIETWHMRSKMQRIGEAGDG
jgi:hypothetical protein